MSNIEADPTLAAAAARPEQFEVLNAPQIDEPKIVEAAPEEHPTDSHELANADHEEKGYAQLHHRQTEVKDLGWNESPSEVPNPLVGGLQNEELWTLIRRFNKVVSALQCSEYIIDLFSKCTMSKRCQNRLLEVWI